MSSREFRHPHVMGQVMLLSRVASHELSLVSVPPKCGKCIRIWPAHQLAKDGCTNCRASTRQRQTSFKKTKGAKANFQQTLSLVMRSTLPEEIEKIYHHNLISDSTLTLLHIQLCLEDMMQKMDISAADAPTSGVTSSPIRLWFTAPELGHPLIDDNHDRPYTHWWARFSVDIYPGTRIWMTMTTRWDISTPA